jgi:integrase
VATELTPRLINKLSAPTDGKDYTLVSDSVVAGLGIRTTKAGAKSAVFSYRTAGGISRRMTIGDVKDWPLPLLRKEAKRLRRIVDAHGDPMAERHELRSAPTVTDLVERWRQEIAPKLRDRSRSDIESMITRHILPAFGSKKVVDVTFDDVERLHRKISQHKVRKRFTEVRANRVVAVCSRLFHLAVKWRMRTDSPVTGLEKNSEQPRRRYLKPAELVRLSAALEKLQNQQAAQVVKLLLLTGARASEVLKARWDQFDLDLKTWTKPASTVKQAVEHHVPLSDEALQILRDIHGAAEALATKYGREVSPWVFPRRYGGKPISDIRHTWTAILRTADISDLHIHDLRHSFASFLVSAGHTLPMIGSLLGHSQAQTTSRYAHLLIDAQRDATNEVGAIMSAAKSGKVVQLTTRERRRASSSRV